MKLEEIFGGSRPNPVPSGKKNMFHLQKYELTRYNIEETPLRPRKTRIFPKKNSPKFLLSSRISIIIFKREKNSTTVLLTLENHPWLLIAAAGVDVLDADAAVATSLADPSVDKSDSESVGSTPQYDPLELTTRAPIQATADYSCSHSKLS